MGQLYNYKELKFFLQLKCVCVFTWREVLCECDQFLHRLNDLRHLDVLHDLLAVLHDLTDLGLIEHQQQARHSRQDAFWGGGGVHNTIIMGGNFLICDLANF